MCHYTFFVTLGKSSDAQLRDEVGVFQHGLLPISSLDNIHSLPLEKLDHLVTN